MRDLQGLKRYVKFDPYYPPGHDKPSAHDTITHYRNLRTFTDLLIDYSELVRRGVTCWSHQLLIVFVTLECPIKYRRILTRYRLRDFFAFCTKRFALYVLSITSVRKYEKIVLRDWYWCAQASVRVPGRRAANKRLGKNMAAVH